MTKGLGEIDALQDLRNSIAIICMEYTRVKKFGKHYAVLDSLEAVYSDLEIEVTKLKK